MTINFLHYFTLWGNELEIIVFF